VLVSFFYSSVFFLVLQHRVATLNLEPVRQAHGGR
jgi:hypothetical protein